MNYELECQSSAPIVICVRWLCDLVGLVAANCCYWRLLLQDSNLAHSSKSIDAVPRHLPVVSL